MRARKPRSSWRRDPSDVVSLSLVEAVVLRDRGCVPKTLEEIGRLRSPIGPCHGADGRELRPGAARIRSDLTIGHIHHGGGRAGKRPKSDRRHCVAICFGHHLADLLGTSKDVQRQADRYLEELEGPVEPDRPWEVIERVRFGRVSSAVSETEGGDDGTV
jgi:hypothetical protein